MNLASYLARRSARRTYFRAQNAASGIITQLYTTSDPATRAFLLDNLSALEAAMAYFHPGAFGPAPNDDEGGRDVAESMASSAELMRMVAATERGAAAEYRGCDPREFGDIDGAELELWGRLARTRDHAARADLIDGIYPHAAERVGGQAAESLACHAGTERELAEAKFFGRPPKAPMAPHTSRRIVFGVCIAIGCLLTGVHLLGQGWLW